MKRFDNVSYDPQANACYITIRDTENIADTVIRKKDIMIDVDSEKNIVGIEILNASKHFRLINKLLLSRESVESCVSY